MTKNPFAAFRFVVLAWLLVIADRTGAQPVSPGPGDIGITVPVIDGAVRHDRLPGAGPILAEAD